MKSLTSYFNECDGAATPGSVMGMGNPMAPDGTNPGSGDMFPKAKRKKVKSGKEKQEWPDDTNEGLLDADFGLSDEDLGMGFDKMLEQFLEYLTDENANPTEQQYMNLYTTFKAACAEVQAKTKPDSISILKACRGKEYTVVTFYKKTSCSGVAKNLSYVNGIEIRRFIKNPRPEAVQIAWDPQTSHLMTSRKWYRSRWWYSYDVNHPQNISMQHSEWFVVPGNTYEQVTKAIS